MCCPRAIGHARGVRRYSRRAVLKLTEVFQAQRSAGDERRAFFAACDYEDKCRNVLNYILYNSPAHHLDERTISSLSKFFAERWRHNFMGGAS